MIHKVRDCRDLARDSKQQDSRKDPACVGVARLRWRCVGEEPACVGAASAFEAGQWLLVQDVSVLIFCCCSSSYCSSSSSYCCNSCRGKGLLNHTTTTTTTILDGMREVLPPCMALAAESDKTGCWSTPYPYQNHHYRHNHHHTHTHYLWNDICWQCLHNLHNHNHGLQNEYWWWGTFFKIMVSGCYPSPDTMI
jgi:hypothetical protein